MEGGRRGQDDWLGLLRGDPIESGFVAATYGLDVRSPTVTVTVRANLALGIWTVSLPVMNMVFVSGI